MITFECQDLDGWLSYFCDCIGARLHMIYPADDPAVAEITAFGQRFRLHRSDQAITPHEVDSAAPALQPSFCLAKADGSAWTKGRAGMLYRDLIADRLGGRFIASHIKIVEGGPVADYVHYHDVRHQLIVVVRGWVRVVYEGQGPAFEMRAGDAVLQAPKIRHRVLASSPGLEVVEITSPALHATYVDHDMVLPGPDKNVPGFARGAATGAKIVRGDIDCAPHDGELLFRFVLEGDAVLRYGQEAIAIARADTFVIPPGKSHALERCSDDLALLDVRL